MFFLNANLIRSNQRATKYQQTTNKNDVPSEISSSLSSFYDVVTLCFFPGMLFVSMTAQGSLLPNPSQLHPNVGLAVTWKNPFHHRTRELNNPKLPTKSQNWISKILEFLKFVCFFKGASEIPEMETYFCWIEIGIGIGRRNWISQKVAVFQRNLTPPTATCRRMAPMTVRVLTSLSPRSWKQSSTKTCGVHSQSLLRRPPGDFLAPKPQGGEIMSRNVKTWKLMAIHL